MYFRFAIKNLIDRASYVNIDDDCEEFLNFCAVIEQVLLHRVKCENLYFSLPFVLQLLSVLAFSKPFSVEFFCDLLIKFSRFNHIINVAYNSCNQNEYIKLNLAAHCKKAKLYF